MQHSRRSEDLRIGGNMELHDLPRLKERSKRRLGRGHGSGRGKTSGRGTKGQKAKEKIGLAFEGGIVPIIKRLPMRHGKGRNKSLRKKPIIVNVKVLNLLPKGSVVDLDFLLQHKIVDGEAKDVGIKILGEGELTVSLAVKLPTSKGAKMKIEKAKGTVLYE